MAWCKTAVTPLLMHWSYCSLALSHQYEIFTEAVLQTKHTGDVYKLRCTWQLFDAHGNYFHQVPINIGDIIHILWLYLKVFILDRNPAILKISEIELKYVVNANLEKYVVNANLEKTLFRYLLNHLTILIHRACEISACRNTLETHAWYQWFLSYFNQICLLQCRLCIPSVCLVTNNPNWFHSNVNLQN